MVRLVACLSDEREEVRNEVLLVLGRLTSSRCENLKTLLAFNEGFEHLLAMIEDDGGLAEGGIITHDCLRLLGNVVESTPSAQRQFCEMGSLDVLGPWFDLAPIIEAAAGDDETINGMPVLEARQRESFHLALRILRNLVSRRSHSPHTKATPLGLECITHPCSSPSSRIYTSGFSSNR